MNMRLPEKRLGAYRKACERWVRDSFDGPMQQLVLEYTRAPIVLFTGAGVSTSSADAADGKPYGLPLWADLLRSLVDHDAVPQWPSDPWDAADAAVAACGAKTFERRLRRTVSRAANYTRRYGQLSSSFVSSAPTLRCVASFCGVLTGRITNPDVQHPTRIHYRSAANPRVEAVITSNYDCFLESAASTIYRRSPLQPVTALGSLAASATRIPVFHVHGYVPHPFWQREARTPLVDRLVVTREDYERVWNAQDVFGTTMGPQIHYFRYYTVLFVGFSFSDSYVCELLRRIRSDYLRHTDRTHFALISETEVDTKGRDFFDDLGVTPITYRDHSEVPALLGRIYDAGPTADRIFEGQPPSGEQVIPEITVKVHHPTGRRYRYHAGTVWPLVQRLRNESVAASRVRALGEQVE